jgi:Rho-related BTB domain-containing protein 1/2
VAQEIGVEYYETSVLTLYGVREVFENACRAALIQRRHQRFWMTDLKRVQKPLLQVSFFIEE